MLQSSLESQTLSNRILNAQSLRKSNSSRAAILMFNKMSQQARGSKFKKKTKMKKQRSKQIKTTAIEQQQYIFID